MKINALCVSVLFAVGLSGAAAAQSITWSQRVYGAEMSPGSYRPYAPAVTLAYTRPLMDWSGAATPGIVVTGAHALGGLVVKLSPIDGHELWRSTLQSWLWLGVNDLRVDASGDVVTAGGAAQSNINLSQWSVEKTSGSTGARLWFQHVSPPTGNGAVEAIAIDHANDILAFASRREETNPLSYVVKFSGATGEVVWTTPIPYYFGPAPALVATDALGNFYVSPRGAILIKVLPDGTIGWTVNLLSSPGLNVCALRALKIDPVTSDAIVAGRANCDTTQQAFAARIRGSDGDVVWAAADVADADTSDAVSIAFAAGGKVIVAGGQAATAQPQRWFAARLSLADGSVDWTVPVADETQYTATDVAVGPGGEVLLSGVCDANAFCAARLDGATGARDWIAQTGASYVPAAANYPNTILASGGDVFFGGKDTSGAATTWTVHRIDNPAPDAIFANSLE